MLRERLSAIRAERQAKENLIPRRGLRRGMNVQELEANAHLPEVQELIRREIFRGTLRVVPCGNGEVRIMPANDLDD